MENNNKKKMDIVTKMSIIGALFLVIIIIVIAAVSCSGDDDDDTENNIPVENETGAAIDEVEPDYVRTIAVIKEVDVSAKTIEAVDINALEKIELLIDDTINIKDAYGTALALAQLDIGDMIDIKFDYNTMVPEYVNVSAQIWERNNVDNLIIDETNKTIQLANDVYNYTDDLVTVYEGEAFDINLIVEADEVSVKGYKDTVWSITKKSGHGYVILENYQKFIGGILEIDNKSIEITEDIRISVSVGEHSIKISKDGYASYISTVLVLEDEEVTLDVGTMESEVGMVEFNVEQDGVQLEIDGEVYSDFTKPINLDYGEYLMTATLTGYAPWESTLIINQPYMSVGIDLNIQPQYIHVDSPVDCELYIDANYIGIIPLESPIEPGLHRITIRKDGYNMKVQNVEILDNGQDVYFTFPELIPLESDTQETGEDGTAGEGATTGDGATTDDGATIDDGATTDDDTTTGDDTTTPSDDVYN
jgi:hypothetical protein